MTEYCKPSVRQVAAGTRPGLEGLLALRVAGRDVLVWAYHGESMYPTLREGDVLEVLPCADKTIRPGDVVVISFPAKDHAVIHRVVSCARQGISTRGDNMAAADPWQVAPADIAGRVIASWRNGRRRKVHGGPAGRALAWCRRGGRVARGLLGKVLKPVYLGAARSGLLARLLPHVLKPRVVEFSSGHRRLVMGRRSLGWQDPQSGGWRIRFPFALLADPSLLSRSEPVAAQHPAPGPSASFSRSAEADVLLRACAACVREAPDTTIADLFPLVNWRKLMHLTAVHCVIGPLFHGLRCSGALSLLPGDIGAEIRGAAFENTARNMRLLRELLPVCRILEDAGIRAAPFKGPALGRLAYGDACLRVSWDIDILVDRCDVLRARTSLDAAGYRFMLDLPADAEDDFLRAEGEYALRHPGREFEIELLTQAVPRHFSCRLDYAELWHHAGKAELGDAIVPCLSAEDHLLLICVHGAKHRWHRLLWILDVAGLLERAPLDHDRLLRLARQSGCQRILNLGLQLARQAFGVDIPRPLEGALRKDRQAGRLAGEILEGLDEAAGPEPGKFRMARFHVTVRERWRDRFRYLLLLAFSPSYSDWKSASLPGGLRFLYYFSRPFRLLKKRLRLYLNRSKPSRRD